MSDVRSRLGDVAQPSWRWGQRAFCPLVPTAGNRARCLVALAGSNPLRKRVAGARPSNDLGRSDREQQTHE
jgi:hypothetical protein